MTKRWPVRDVSAPSFMTVEAPINITGIDAVEIRVSFTPMRGGERINQLHSAQQVTLAMRDSMALKYVTAQMLDQMMRAWQEAA